MSQENVEITWRINEAFNRGDWDSWSSLIDPEIVYYEGESYLDTPPVMGREQMRKASESFIAELDGFRADIEELIDAGDRVLCVKPAATGLHPGVDDHVLAVGLKGASAHQQAGVLERRQFLSSGLNGL